MAPKWPTRDVLAFGPTIYSEEELRIVMVGKTGSGKSATGNTILGREDFESRVFPESITKHCTKAHGEVEGQKFAVIDTPGVFDTRMTEAENLKEVAQCISYAAPGPHVFLVVIRLDRFTEEEKETVQKIQEVFGEDADRYSMVLFTHGDQLKGTSIEDFLKGSKELQDLVTRCNNQYHVFNNDLKEDRSQVTELLHKIRKIREKNRGRHYTTDMFQVAERVIQEETKRIQKEMEEKMLKEQETERKKIEAKYETEMSEVKGEVERLKELLASRERELEEKNKKLEEMQQQTSRQRAETSCCVLKKIKDWLSRVFRLVSGRTHSS